MKLSLVALLLIAVDLSASLHFAQDYPDNEHYSSNGVTVIMFTRRYWDEIVQGDLAPSKKVRVVYDSNRLQEGAGGILADIKYTKNGKIYPVELHGSGNTTMITATLTIPPTATTLIIWFKRHENNGRYFYDSNYGMNYKFSFNQIVFTDTWEEYVNGHLYPGGEFDILYNRKRLPWNDHGYLGLGRAWNIFAFVKFSDDGPVVKKMLQGPVGGDPTMNTRYDIPNDAKKVITWFEYTGYIHASRYDSNNDANYHFTLS